MGGGTNTSASNNPGRPEEPIAVWLQTEPPAWISAWLRCAPIRFLGSPQGVAWSARICSTAQVMNDPRSFLLAAKGLPTFAWGGANLRLSAAEGGHTYVTVPTESWLDASVPISLWASLSATLGMSRVADICSSQQSAVMASLVRTSPFSGDGMKSMIADAVACALMIVHDVEDVRCLTSPRLDSESIVAERLGAIEAFGGFRGTVMLTFRSSAGSAVSALLSTSDHSLRSSVVAIGDFGQVDLTHERLTWKERTGAIIEDEIGLPETLSLMRITDCSIGPRCVGQRLPSTQLAALCEAACLSAITGAQERCEEVARALMLPREQ